MKRLLLIVLASTAACKAGEGTGSALGPLFILNCNGYGHDQGTPAMPRVFDLKPTFFAAEPIEEGDQYFKVNRLIIRMQPTGRSRELNDVLSFDIPDSLQVARCVRGAVINGKPDYDGDRCIPAANGGTRLKVAPDALVHASLAPYSTCARALVATAISTSQAEWESWIELTQFGTAAQAGLPETRTAVPLDFKVDINEPLVAPAFLLKLRDDATLEHFCGSGTGTCMPLRSKEDAQIGGSLQGDFSFQLQRGQGAQTFP